MKNYSIYIISISLIIFACQGQINVDKAIYKDVGWTVFFPKNYDTSDSLLIALNKNTSKDFLQTLFAVRQKNNNSFIATINPYISTKETWEESFEVSKHLMIDQIKSMGSNIKIVDTSSSTEMIDKLKFLQFGIVTFYVAQNLTLNTTIYYRQIGTFDLTVTISYVDSMLGNQYKNILFKSKWEK